MSVNYKTIFELKVFHEYFLTGPTGVTVFEKSSQADRLSFLEDQFAQDQMPINDDIDFVFPEKLKSLYAGLGLKINPTYSGCHVSVKVVERAQADGSTFYSPVVPFPAGLRIWVQLAQKSNALRSYTHSKLHQALPAIFYFSNENVPSPKSFPFLTASVPAIAAVPYEQGDLGYNGTNVQEFYFDGTTAVWQDVKGSSFANENDRLLLREKFTYTIPNITGLTEAEFSLKDKNADEIALFKPNRPAGLAPQQVLDFSSVVKSLPVTKDYAPADFLYSLEVTGNNGYHSTHPVFFGGDLLTSDSWALIGINTNVGNPDFNLLAPDGFLKRRRDAFGVFAPAPVFEVNLKSRFPFWRFINDHGKELFVSAQLTDYVVKTNNVLTSKRPRALAKHFSLLQKEGSSDTVRVPNPANGYVSPSPDGRLYLDIKVPDSDLFPTIP